MNNIKQITIDQLKVGMFIAESNAEWIPESNSTRKGLVHHPKVIDGIRALGVKTLYIDVSKGRDCEKESHCVSDFLTPKVSFNKELANATQIKDKAAILIELSNKKLAIVLEANLAEKNKPKVIQVYDMRTRRYDNKRIIDLADERCQYHIVKSVCATSYGIKVGDFIQS